MEVNDENRPVLHAKGLNGEGDFRRTTPGLPLKPVNDDQRLSSQKMKTSPKKVTPSNSPYTYIRQLDSAERWIERTSVLTKQDHALNLQHASSILEEIVNSLPVSNVSNSWINKELVGQEETITQHSQDSKISVPTNNCEIDELANLMSGLGLSVSFSSDLPETPVAKKDGFKSVSTLALQSLEVKEPALMKQVDDLTEEHPAADCLSKSSFSCSSLAAENRGSDQNSANRFEQDLQKECKDHVLVKEGNNVDPFQPNHQLDNSISCNVQVIGQSHDHQKGEGLLFSDDPLKKSGHSVDALTVPKEPNVKACSFPPEETLDEVRDLSVDQHQLESKLVSSPAPGKLDTFADELNLNAEPFKTTAQLVNTPVAGKFDGAMHEHDLPSVSFGTNMALANSPVTNTDEGDPFQPKVQLFNSPSIGKPDSTEEIHCFKADSLNPTGQHSLSANENSDKLLESIRIESTKHNENEQPVGAPIYEIELTAVKPLEANYVISPVAKTLEVSMGDQDLNVTTPNTQLPQLYSSSIFELVKSSDELEDPIIPMAQLVNSPVSLGKHEGAGFKQDLSPLEAKLNTPINKSDLNVKPLRPEQRFSLSTDIPEVTQINDDLHLKVALLKTEVQLNSAGGKLDIGCDEVKASLCSPNSSSNEQQSHLAYNRSQITLEGLLVDEIQKFSTQGAITPVKIITQIHDPVESQLITEIRSASDNLEVSHVKNTIVAEKTQNESVTSPALTINNKAENEKILTKELIKSKDPFASCNKTVKNTESIQTEMDKMLKGKCQIVIEDANVSKKSDDQFPKDAAFLTPNPLNIKTQLINTPAPITNNCNSSNSNVVTKGLYDHETCSSTESFNATKFNSSSSESISFPEDKEQNFMKTEPLKDKSDKVHTQEDMLNTVTDNPIINEKESFHTNSAVDESIPLNQVKESTCKEDNNSKISKDESIPFLPQDKDIAENEMFIPATEAFNNPEFFEMLEHSSSSKAPNSKRGSVLLKFDPLQDRRDSLASKSLNTSPETVLQGQAQKPGRISDIFKDSKLGMSFIDESVCLFGTPPRVARRRTLTRRVHNYRAQSIAEENSANEVDMIFGLDNEGDGMDSIINYNLHPTNEGPRLVDFEEMPAYTESDLKQIRAELTMHFQELMLKKDRDFQEKLKEQEQLAELEKEKFKTETDGLKQKIKSLQGKLKSLNDVMKEYEDTISQLIVDKEKAQFEVEKITVELSELYKYNSQVMEENKTLEKSFDDLFHRYEKLKQTLEKAAENEKILKQAVQTAQEKYKSSKEYARKIKEVAEAKITELDEKYEKLSNSTKLELTGLEASLKMKDMQVQRLENTLEQKNKENKELTDLCDSLINKVSAK